MHWGSATSAAECKGQQICYASAGLQYLLHLQNINIIPVGLKMFTSWNEAVGHILPFPQGLDAASHVWQLTMAAAGFACPSGPQSPTQLLKDSFHGQHVSWSLMCHHASSARRCRCCEHARRNTLLPYLTLLCVAGRREYHQQHITIY